jgi:hypothetical protein
VAKYSTKAITGVRPVPQPDDATLCIIPVDVEFPTAAYLVNDTHEVMDLPIGVRCVDFDFIFPDIDSNGTPAFAFSFGELTADGLDMATPYVTGVIAGQSTTLVRNTTSVAAQRPATTVRRLGMKITTAAATYVGAGLVGQVVAHLRG